MKKYFSFLFSPWFMGALFILFAVSMAFATLIENDFGAATAMKQVYGAKWFELILLLLVINLIGQIIYFKLLTLKKISILLFHISFIIIILGAGITRYFGFEGSIHIREGEIANTCYSNDKYINLEVEDKAGNKLVDISKKYMISASSVDNFSKNLKIDNQDYSLKLVRFIPNALESIEEIQDGKPMVFMLITRSMRGREPYVLAKGDSKEIGQFTYGFTDQTTHDVNIIYENEVFYLESSYNVVVSEMKDQQSTIVKAGEKISIKPMILYTINGTTIVFQKLSKSGVVKPISFDHQNMKSQRNALEFELKEGDNVKHLNLWYSKDQISANDSLAVNGNKIKLSINQKQVRLPFSIKLNKFVLERYPGSNSPSSYKSEVTLLDTEKGIEIPYSIYMNHILKHRGYRFYQSSYDEDEL